MSGYRYKKGAAAENALIRWLRKQPGTMAFRTPGSRGAWDVVMLEGVEPLAVTLIQVKAGREPSEPEIARLKARMRKESAFPCTVVVVWARPVPEDPKADVSKEFEGWEFMWL